MRLFGSVFAALMIHGATASAADCPASSDLSSLPTSVDTVTRVLTLSPMVCADTSSGVYCGSVGMRTSVTVTGAFIGSRTSSAMVSRLRSCAIGSADPGCRFSVDFDATRIQAGRRADTPGWRMIDITAERIDLAPAPCR